MTPNQFIEAHRIGCFFHFTDERNLGLIREHGGLHPLAELRRMKITVPAPGGNEVSQGVDTHWGLDEYVHLCFMDQHPMEYRARQDGRIKTVRWLRVSPTVLTWPDIRITLDVSNKTGVPILPWADAWNRLDTEVLFTRTNWKDQSIQARLQQAKKCELLVPRSILLADIRGV